MMIAVDSNLEATEALVINIARPFFFFFFFFFFFLSFGFGVSC
jgi:hypothetical protein